MDATYRHDLRELNELHFQRFDAKIEQRIAELRAEMQVGFANLENRLEQRLGAQMKWMFGFWLGTVIPLAGLMIAFERWGGG